MQESSKQCRGQVVSRVMSRSTGPGNPPANEKSQGLESKAEGMNIESKGNKTIGLDTGASVPAPE